MPADWNTLEIAKLVASFATPIVVLCLGVYIHRVTKRFEHFQWRNQKLIEKRLMVYDSLAPKFNCLLCYFTNVGRWKDINPPAIVSMKRDIDTEIHLARPLFSPDFFRACMDFMSLCFETYVGWGEEPKLRAEFKERRKAHPNWLPIWERDCFSAPPTGPTNIHKSYARLMEVFAAEMGFSATFVQAKGDGVQNNA